MRIFKNILFFLISIIFILLLFPQRTYAYLDPGIGSIIIQVVLGALFTGLVTVRIFWGRVKGFFVNKFSKNKKSEQ